MPKVERTITINAPIKKVFGYVDDPSHLPEFWPSLFEVKDVKMLPGGGHRFMWFYNFAGKRAQGTTESAEYVPYERIVDMAKGDVESTITWSFSGENGTACEPEGEARGLTHSRSDWKEGPAWPLFPFESDYLPSRP